MPDTVGCCGRTREFGQLPRSFSGDCGVLFKGDLCGAERTALIVFPVDAVLQNSCRQTVSAVQKGDFFIWNRIGIGLSVKAGGRDHGDGNDRSPVFQEHVTATPLIG